MTSYVPDGISKIDRSQFLTFINTTPNTTATWSVLGVGITEYGIDYNPQVDTEKWIIEDSARNDHTSNQKQGSITQKCYKGDPVFEFINEGRDKLNYKTQVLDVDRWNGDNGSYPAKKNDVIITITKYMGENAEIEYEMYYDGDPIDGSVQFTGTTPSFTPESVSL